jgi:chemotaxis-related protein WspD
MTRPNISPAARLLDREAPENYLSEWTEIIAAETRDVEIRATSSVVFRIGSEWLALPTSAFQEVAELSGIHRLPHSRSSVLNGLVNVRGELLLCAALDVVLGLVKVQVDARVHQDMPDGRLLVCSYKGDRVAFPVNKVVGIHTYSARDVRNVPATLSKAVTCMVGVLYWNEMAIGCLDTELLFQAVNKGLE